MKRKFKRVDWYVTAGVFLVNLAILTLVILANLLLEKDEEATVQLMFLMGAIFAGYIVFASVRISSPAYGALIGLLGSFISFVIPGIVLEGFNQVELLALSGVFVVIPSIAGGAALSWFVQWWRKHQYKAGTAPLEGRLREPSITENLQEPIDNKIPVGIGGWLLLPAIGLVIGPIFYLANIIFNIQDERLLSAGPDVQTFVVGGKLVLLALVAVVSFSFFTRKRITPTLVIIYLLCGTAFWIITACVYGSCYYELKEQVPFVIVRAVVPSIISCAIWIPYFAKSRRVKATFVR
jgi:hypothetical protein